MDSVLIGEILSVVMFFGIIAVLMLGFPVAFTLPGTALAFALVGWLVGAFDPSNLSSIAPRYLGIMLNEVLVAVPLFIFMGMMLERSGIAEQLLVTMGRLFGDLRGGLGISVVLVGTVLAASTGIVGATVITMGLLSLPAMIRAGYDPKLASGIICASGTLGQIIPPSTVLIFMGDMLGSMNAQAQMAKGNFAPQIVSVGNLFAGAFIPGLILSGSYILFVIWKAWREPDSAPALIITAEERSTLLRDVLVSMIPTLALIVAVLGSILAGFATPTESAAVGAVGAMLLAAMRGRFTLKNLCSVMESTAVTTSMIFVILLGASMFGLVFRVLGGDALMADLITALPGGQLGAIIFVMVLMFVLGFILDTFEIIFIIVPITAPVLFMLDVDPVWLGVIIAVNLQTSFLTPPFGFSLIYLRSVAPPTIRTTQLYRGAIPFVGLQIVVIALLIVFPELATWLPKQIYG